jgi:hypothetical protein
VGPESQRMGSDASAYCDANRATRSTPPSTRQTLAAPIFFRASRFTASAAGFLIFETCSRRLHRDYQTKRSGGPIFFPLVEGIDVRDAGRTAEVIFATKVEGQLATLTIRLSYAQAATLAGLLEPFRKD